MRRFLSLISGLFLIGHSVAGLCETACDPNPPKAEGVIIMIDELLQVAGNVGMGYAFTAHGLESTGLQPGGPLLIWIIRSASESTRTAYRNAGLEINPGEIYTWDVNPKVKFPFEALKTVKYLCTFDQSTTNAVLIKTYLKRIFAEAEDGDLAQVNTLLAANAKAYVTAKNAWGGTPLMVAARAGHLDVVTALIAAKADVNARDTGGDTALMDAAGAGQAEVVRTLLAAKANVNARSAAGYTALIHAAGKGDAATMRLLLDSHADVNVRAKDGTTALSQASEMHHSDVVELLRQHGARK